ncbi:2-hydroxychromene-2-carboxylate isomerase [Sphingorhabdus sp. 109]|jgi:2-hydroxychromene-2-carboxylate isomerase|uniref:2-hydroxychromene-2-carboxylate isomerase n=1 Tax=Sphingorhabdus sp. 109 TaxID=2653173 RepID=UPI0012EF59F1|nr:2-hydroxychromene-2-carboxylate isomerase [Sphingorhabdus sp. 109]VWX59218.1 2-hydroxychromene-2-carboxylate isomerase [Sphingorhabdus sp. 109]
MTTVEFYFDLSSPWTCLAFHNIQPIIEDNGAEIIWKPFLVGGVFNAVNQDVYAARENPDNRKFVHSFRVLKDWATLAGLPMNFPSEHHPVKSVHAMRLCCALEEDQAALHKFATAAFNAYYGDQRNLDDPDVLIAIANEVGLDGAALAAQTQEQAIKNRLRANTEEAIARGAYGSPSMFVPFGKGERMYFGNDQLPLVNWAIKQAAG